MSVVIQGKLGKQPGRERASGRRPATVRIGYVPLMDAAPLIAADALGYFERAGLRVNLEEELGWGSIRDKIVYGELDAAHAPGGLLFSILLGIHAPARSVDTDPVINLQGNAITLSRRLWQKGVTDGDSFRMMIRSESPGNRDLLSFLNTPATCSCCINGCEKQVSVPRPRCLS